MLDFALSVAILPLSRVFIVPFVNKFPKNTKLYKLMTTKPGD
jgi:hypothetical protein